MCKPEHLHEIGQRAFAAVVLPVGIGDEADRRIEGKVGRHRRHFRRIEGQRTLQPHQRVKNDKSADMKEQHGDRVGQPMLLPLLVDPADPVEAGLNRPQNGGQERPLAIEDARHVKTKRLHQRDDDCAEQQDLHPANKCHDREPLGVVGTALAAKIARSARAAARRRSGKTAAPRKRDRRVNSRRSWPFSSKPFAAIGVAHRQREEAKAERQHDDVLHLNAPSAINLENVQQMPSTEVTS